MIQVAVIPVRNGDVPLNTGDVFRFASILKFEGEGLKKYDNPPIFENEVQVNLFIEAINWQGNWVATLPPKESATVHLLGDDAQPIVAVMTGLKTQTPGQYVCIS